MKYIILFSFFSLAFIPVNAQNVGIGTNTPQSLLHVAQGSVLFSNTGDTTIGSNNPPISGAGRRIMWYSEKAAFRAGYVSGNNWNKDSVGAYSVAMGYETKAKAMGSVALGYGCTASGHFSFSAGLSNISTGNGSVCLGVQNTATEQNATAIGLNSKASAPFSTVIGSSSLASGDRSLAMGAQAQATNDHAIAIGNSNTASGYSALAMGTLSTATGDYSCAIGRSTDADGYASVAMGYRTVARGYATMAIGMYNNPVLASAQTSVTNTTPLFIIGNGDALDNTSNAMVVLKNGNIGIGTSVPTERMDIMGNIILNNTANPTFELQADNVQKGFVQLSGDNLRIGTYSANNAGTVIFRLNGADRFTINPNGNATLTGTLTQNSDAKFKDAIEPIDNALDKVMQLTGYQYHWKPELKRDSTTQIGLIAQNVESVLPELVITNKEGDKSVAYQNMVAVLIEAIKEQQQLIVDLKNEISEMKKLVEQK